METEFSEKASKLSDEEISIKIKKPPEPIVFANEQIMAGRG